MAQGISTLLSALDEKSGALAHRIGELQRDPAVRARPALAQRLSSGAAELIAEILAAESAARSVGWRRRNEATERLARAHTLLERMNQGVGAQDDEETDSTLARLQGDMSEVLALLTSVEEALGTSRASSLYRIA